MTLSRSLLRASAWLAGSLAVCSSSPLSSNPAYAAVPKVGVVAGSGTNQGGRFTAGPEGAEYQLPSLARLSLGPGAVVQVFPRSQQLQLTPGAKTNTYSVALIRGRMNVTVPAKPKSAVLCSLGKSSAVVGAGQAAIVANADTSTVANVSGDVRTLVADHWQTLAAGTLQRIEGDRASTPVPTIAPPAIAPGQRLWFSPGDPIPLGGFGFAKVAGAERYELVLRAADGSQQLRSLRGTRLEDPFGPLGPGRYELMARSVDAEGIEGTWSAAEAVRVVGVTLPPGGYASAGDIFIGAGQEVRFSNTEGLEMTYEGAGRFVPASGAVSLYRGETTMVSFRVPGSVYPTTARLRPRGLYAHVELGPSRAVWPTDPVQIAIELRNKGGEPLPPGLELKTDVMVGIEPIEVDFTRDGNRLVGTVPPTEKPGPWVLRVEVKDQYGSLLGRDFLEIAKAPLKPPAKPVSARVASK